MPSLSVLIPARNEMFLKQTIDSILLNMRGDTEIIVILDGALPLEPILDHPKVKLVYHPTPIGQRAAVNEAARLSKADYVMKLDAHCAVDEGFDVKLMQPYEDEELDRDVTTMPRLYNLHAFDWVCDLCGRHFYQGPARKECGIRTDEGVKQNNGDGSDSGCWDPAATFHREVIYKPRFNRGSDHLRFDATLHFHYWRAFKKRPDYKQLMKRDGDFPELFGNLGACVFMRRDRFWELGGMDEEHGSWGQFGTEVSCKAWLSGGRQVTNTRTWYAHLFRTQKGFSFPYPQDDKQVTHAREYSRDLWLNNKWPQQIRPLSWLVRRFWPINVVPAETEWKDPGPPPTWGVVYYTDNQLDPRILDLCQKQLRAATGDAKIVSVSQQPMAFGENLYLPLKRSRESMFIQILAGLEALDTDYVFLCEHDVMYHPSHFEIVPPRDDMFYYNQNIYRIDTKTGRTVTWDLTATSGLCANRQLLIDHYRQRVADVAAVGYKHSTGYEPGLKTPFLRTWKSKFPNLDLRHDANLTASRWSAEEFHDKSTCQNFREADVIPGWGKPIDLRHLWIDTCTD